MINFWCRVAAHWPHEASGRTRPGLVTLRAVARAFQSEHVTWGKAAGVFLTMLTEKVSFGVSLLLCRTLTLRARTFLVTLHRQFISLCPDNHIQVFKGNGFSASYRQARFTPPACIGPWKHLFFFQKQNFDSNIHGLEIWDCDVGFGMCCLTGVCMKKKLDWETV